MLWRKELNCLSKLHTASVTFQIHLVVQPGSSIPSSKISGSSLLLAKPKGSPTRFFGPDQKS
jgi:hypothetical protein